MQSKIRVAYTRGYVTSYAPVPYISVASQLHKYISLHMCTRTCSGIQHGVSMSWNLAWLVCVVYLGRRTVSGNALIFTSHYPTLSLIALLLQSMRFAIHCDRATISSNMHSLKLIQGATIVISLWRHASQDLRVNVLQLTFTHRANNFPFNIVRSCA